MDAEITFRSEQRLTQADFTRWLERLPADDIHHYELIHGRIVMTAPASFGHGVADSILNHRLRNHVEAHDLGVILGSSAGYELPSGDTLEPDVSFISKERLAAAPTQNADRFSTIVPDLVVEILSPSTARRDRTEKKEIYAANGVREYWLVDLKRRSVTILVLHDSAYDEGTTLTSGLLRSEVLLGLGLAVETIFA